MRGQAIDIVRLISNRSERRFMARGSTSKTLVWILMGLLILGLGGFGVTNLSGHLRSIGSVGNRDITVSAYSRAVQDEIRAREASMGQPIPFSVARALQLDQVALARLIANTAVDHEASQLGISAGDENLHAALLQIQGFRGIDGQFDRESYQFYLDRTNQSQAEFEQSLRDDLASGLLQQAVLAGLPASDTYADTLVDFLAERRDFTWAALSEDDLAEPLPEPDTETLAKFHTDNAARFTLPERKGITYAWLTPDMILDQVELGDSILKENYDERSNEFNQPERRLVERLVFPDTAAAEAAKSAITAGEKSFEQIVTERGLALGDIDMGDVVASDLGAAGEPVFAANPGGVIGPFQTDLGPALFRINGVLAARTISFEDAREQLHEELAVDRARRLIDQMRSDIEDLLAGGATLEEIAQETDMQLGQTNWTADSSEDVAGYAAFQEEAAKVTVDDFPSVVALEDGGIFALRLDTVLAPELQPLEMIRTEVEDAWAEAEITSRLVAQAEALLPQITQETDMAALGLTVTEERDITRTDFIAGTPQSFLTGLFKMEPGESRVFEAPGGALIARLDAVHAPDESNPEVGAARTALSEQAASAQAQDLYQYYINDVQARAGLALDQNAINAVLANFQ